MRRWLTFRLMLVVMVTAVALAAAGSGVAQEATPTTDAQEATPLSEGESSTPWDDRGACPDPGEVDQEHMIKDPSDGSALTVRLVAGSRPIAPWSGTGSAIAHVKWGRICIEPATVITAEDGGDEIYPSVYMIHVEEGEVFVSLTPNEAGGGYVYFYDGNQEVEVTSGQLDAHAHAGDMIIMFNTFAVFSNPSLNDPATIVAVQVADPNPPSGCASNCWLPSCYMPVAQEAPTCAHKDSTTP